MPEMISIPKDKLDDLQSRLHDLEKEIADIKQSDQSLRKYQLLSENARDIILFVNKTTGRILEANRAAINAYGYAKEELLSITIYDLREKSIKPLVSSQMVLADEEGILFETTHIRKDGSRFPVEVSSIGVDLNGENVLLSIIRDITERQKAYDEVRMLKHSIDVHYDGIYWMDSENRFVYVNDAGCRALGYTREELIGKALSDISPRATAEKMRDVWTHLRKDGSFFLESVHRRKDGSEFPVEVVSTYIQFGGREYNCGFVRDITERKRVEKNLFDSRQMLQLVMDHIPQRIFWKDRNSIYLGCNKPLALDCGYADPGALIGKTDYETASAETADTYRADDRVVMETGLPKINYEERQIKPDGSLGWLRTSKVPLRDQEDRVIGVLGMYEDITERKRAEETVLKLSQAVEQSPASIVITDTQGNIEFVNSRYADITGYEQKEVIGKNPSIFKTDHTTPEEYERLWAAISSGKVWHGEFLNKKKNGELFWEDATISPIVNSSGIITNYLAIKEDITQRKNLEAQLLQAQKMEAIGQLAGGLAHDFNNILSAIIGYGSIIKMKLPADDPMQLNLDPMLESAQRAAQLTHSLLAFSRKQIMNLRPVKLNEILSRLEKFLRRVIGEDVELTINGVESTVLADSVQIQQVLMNLAANARDAMPRGGSLTIETDLVKLSDAVVHTHGLEKAGSYVVISVTDSGSGMNEDTKKRIFEPFFTTKETGRGTGLGLSIVYGIIKQHGGEIRVYSRMGYGTTFKIYLPVYQMPVEHHDETKESDVVVGGTETVLIAEDDIDVRKFFTGVLVDYGYTVIAAENGVDAVKKFSQHKDAIRLCILDIIMPRMSGKEVYDEILLQRPDIRAIFCSGYTADKFQHESIPPGCQLIQKPVLPQELLKKVREALDRK